MDRSIIDDLKSKSMNFTVEEIEEMMNEELSKAPEEMDTEFIDICADILDKAYSTESEKPEADKKRIKLNFKKIISLVAAFAIIITGTAFSVHQLNSSKISESPVIDFEIVAYAEDSNAVIKEINNKDITLMNYQLELKQEDEGYYIKGNSDSDGLAIKSDDDIDEVIFESEKGVFSYIDSPLKKQMVSENKYYSAVIPITEEQSDDYFKRIEAAKSSNEDTLECKEQFVKEIMLKTDCTEYIYDSDFDASKITEGAYTVSVSDMGDLEENYYEHCILISDHSKTSCIFKDNQKKLTAKVYNTGDKIEFVYYDPSEATEYLLNNPDTSYEDLPSDTITITVKYKNGQSVTKSISAEFNSDGVLTMKINQ